MFLSNPIEVGEKIVILDKDAEEKEVTDFLAFLTFSSDLIQQVSKLGYLIQVEDLQVFEALWLLPPLARDFLCNKMVEYFTVEQVANYLPRQKVISFQVLMIILFPEPDEPDEPEERKGDWEIVREMMKTAGAEMVAHGAVEILQYVWRWNGKNAEIVSETTKDSVSIIRMEKRKRVAPTDVMATLFRLRFGEEFWMIYLGDRDLIFQIQRETGKVFKVTSDYADNRPIDSIFIEGSHVASINLSVFTPSVFRLPGLRRLHLFALKNPEAFSTQSEDWSSSQLEELIISYCKLSKLPSSIGSLVRLKKLKLEEENGEILLLSGESSLIPTSVREIDLSNSHLTELKADIFQRIPFVEVLLLNNNTLKRIPDEIRLMGRLRELHLKKNNLEELPIGLSSIPALSIITVSGNPTPFFEKLPSLVLELNIKKFAKLEIPEEEKTVLGYIQAMLEEELTLRNDSGAAQGFSIENHHLTWIGIPNELAVLPSIIFSLPFLRKIQIGSRSYEIIKNPSS